MALPGDQPATVVVAPGPAPNAPQPRRRAPRNWPRWLELPAMVLTALLLTCLIQTFVGRVYLIQSDSMAATLNGATGSGDHIVVDELSYDFHPPRPGDIVVFRAPPGWDRTEVTDEHTDWLRQLGAAVGLADPDEYDLVKRVIAVGGQTVSCCDAKNRVLVDGKPLTEPYVYWEPGFGGPAAQIKFAPVTVPAGDLFVMGDNRDNSDDSRYQNGGGVNGVVPVRDVIGKARAIIWPLSRWRGIGDNDPQHNGIPPEGGIVAVMLGPTFWFRRGKRGRARHRRWSQHWSRWSA